MNETRELLQMILLNRACDAGEGIIRVGANQTNRANDENQNHRQHNGVLGDVLALFVVPELLGEVEHYTPFLAGVFQQFRGRADRD
jgi:hypothetical protein